MNTRTKTTRQTSPALLREILLEIRHLREEMVLFVPTERLDEYENAVEIRKAYMKAIKKSPAYEYHAR